MTAHRMQERRHRSNKHVFRYNCKDDRLFEDEWITDEAMRRWHASRTAHRLHDENTCRKMGGQET
jgi:hypothetical protein